MSRHPMIGAVGEEEFLKVLNELPDYYSPLHADNFEPITMWLIWLCDNDNLPSIEKMERLMTTAYDKWVNGITAKEAAQYILEESCSNS